MQNARFVLLFVSLLFIQSVSYSQSRQRWSVGPRVGLNLTNFTGDGANSLNTADANKLLPGLSAGVGFMYSDISHFGFAFDILYAQRGSKQATTGNGSAITRVNYLEVPITARYFLTTSGNFRPNLYAGVVPALRLNAFAKGANSDSRADITELFRPADVGLTAGFQANFRAGDRQRFTVDARYTHGLSNISRDLTDLRNQMITIGLGYNFGIGRQYQPGDPKL